MKVLIIRGNVNKIMLIDNPRIMCYLTYITLNGGFIWTIITMKKE